MLRSTPIQTVPATVHAQLTSPGLRLSLSNSLEDTILIAPEVYPCNTASGSTAKHVADGEGGALCLLPPVGERGDFREPKMPLPLAGVPFLNRDRMPDVWVQHPHPTGTQFQHCCC